MNSRTPSLALFAPAIILGAFLLFQVQPMIGRVILPWFGGSTSVWSTCLVFFQAVLFAGYLWAHILRTRLGTGSQALLQGGLVAASLLFLPLSPDTAWKPPGDVSPVLHIISFLAVTLGLPFFLLSAASPLLQAWFSLKMGREPYRLYAFSNGGSLLGLLAYPFVVEPFLPLSMQQMGWSAGYLLWALTMIGISAVMLRRSSPAQRAPEHVRGPGGEGEFRRPLVFGLAFCGSLLMAAATHSLCEDIAVVPLLWVLPLSLYLLTFIVTFGWERSYRRPLFFALLAATTAGAVAALFLGLRMPPLLRIVTLSSFLFCGCMVCHGEMVRLKPGPARLTGFYMILSGGGVLGTSFVVFAAPVLFDGYWEIHVAIALCWIMALWALLQGESRVRSPAALKTAAAAGMLALVVVLRVHTVVELAGTVKAERNFYGALKIVEVDPDDRESHRLELINGGVLHGSQFVDPRRRDVPTAYYGLRSGLGFALRSQRDRQIGRGGGPLRIGVVGLGVGVVAAHAAPGDLVRFYEINPAVTEAARENFTFLSRSQGRISVAAGDARLVMEREIERGEGLKYDLLVVDAFTGDAIPVHLLTRESLEVYLSRLAQGGTLAFNISNRYLDLRPLAAGLARDAGLALLVVDSLGEPESGTRGATWALMARESSDFSETERAAASRSRPASELGEVLWTDDYSNLFRLLL